MKTLKIYLKEIFIISSFSEMVILSNEEKTLGKEQSLINLINRKVNAQIEAKTCDKVELIIEFENQFLKYENMLSLLNNDNIIIVKTFKQAVNI